MSHLRNRILLQLILEKLRRAPILLLNGARQTGKSFLIRELVASARKNVRFETLDRTGSLSQAKRNPSLYLARSDPKECLAIDEAQKAPALFDVAKAIVDVNKSPGQYIFLGSTEFSHRTKIKESLTGRATRATLYPFTLAETQSENLDNLAIPMRLLKKVPRFSQPILSKYLERGGLPGIFAIRSDAERSSAFFDWLDLILTRDLGQLPGFRADAALARSVLECVAQDPYVTTSDIMKLLGTTFHRVQKHLEGLRALFVINTIPKFAGSAGSEANYICDVGVAKFLGARFETCLRTWCALELLAHISYADDGQLRLFTYHGERGASIDFILQKKPGQFVAFKVYPFEAMDGRDFEVLRSFVAHRPGSEAFALVPPNFSGKRMEKIHTAPWAALG